MPIAPSHGHRNQARQSTRAGEPKLRPVTECASRKGNQPKAKPKTHKSAAVGMNARLGAASSAASASSKQAMPACTFHSSGLACQARSFSSGCSTSQASGFFGAKKGSSGPPSMPGMSAVPNAPFGRLCAASMSVVCSARSDSALASAIGTSDTPAPITPRTMAPNADRNPDGPATR